MEKGITRRSFAALPLLALAGCGGGGDEPPSRAMGALTQDKIAALIAKMQRKPLQASQLVASDPVYTWSGKPVERAFSMQGFCTPVEDQLAYGSCTANAVVGACEMYLQSAGRYVRGQDDLSRMFNYWWSGVLDSIAGQDIGRTPRSAMLAAAQYGICKESTEPYVEQSVTVAPSDAAVAEGFQHKVSKFAKVPIDPDNLWNTVTNIKQAVNDGYPVTMAFHCHRWVFDIHGPMDTHYTQPGPMNFTDPMNAVVGGHEVVIVGFLGWNDENGGYFIVRNSWGDQWGDGGYWAMPYVYVRDAFEFWAVQGFDGIGQQPVPAPTPTVAAARQQLAQLVLGTLNADGTLSFASTSSYAPAAAVLERMGLDNAGISEVVQVDQATLTAWLAGNQAVVDAWLALLK